MKPFAPILLALCLTTSALAQTATPTPQFTDPANLRGERVKPSDGRELPVDQGAKGLEQLLRKLNTRASIMNIVAHPDDEDGGMLTLYSRGLGARVADLSLNRGEGGQNAMTADFEDALGLLRTQELLSSDRFSGVDQFFGTEVDFGFSKTKQESFAKWGHDRVLYDVVRAIRLYRPLILTSTWIGGVTDGHGQHQVSGQIAQEAFLAAGDPKVFPELTAEGILPWQPLRIYARVPQASITPQGLFDYATGQYTPAKFTNYVTRIVTTTPPTPDVTVHEGDLDPLLGDDSGPLSYIQFARQGLSQQKSQIGPNGRTAPTGAFDVAYHLYGDCTNPLITPAELCHLSSLAPPTQTVIPSAAEGPATPSAPASPSALSPPDLDPAFFNGIDTSINSLTTLLPNAPKDVVDGIQAISEDASKAQTLFDPEHPETIAPQLANGLRATDNVIQLVEDLTGLRGFETVNILHELHIKHVQFEQALVLALGLEITATTEQQNVSVGSHPSVTIRLTTANAATLRTSALMVATSPVNGALFGEVFGCVPAEAPQPIGTVTFVPLKSPEEQSCFLPSNMTAVPTRPYFSRSNIEQPLYQLSDEALRNAPATPAAITVWVLLSYNGVTFEIGHIVTADKEPINLVSPRNVSLSSHAQVVSRSQPKFRIEVTDVSESDRGSFTLSSPNVQFSKADRFNSMLFGYEGTLPDASARPFTIFVLPKSETADTTPLEGYRSIGYGDLPRPNFYTPAETRIVPVDLKLPTKAKIAYLSGTGDAVPEALASIGLAPTMLTVADLTADKLKQYDTVILGVRTYAAHPELHGDPTKALLDYARNGGNVVVQYQSTEFTAADAPYPLSLGSNEKVVDETAPVQILALNSLLTTPNRITSSDFNGWVEERGHGFLTSWDPHYSALTETHDPGAPSEGVLPQAPQRGGLITTPLGSGRWTYVAFALYRQLPEAVPGAFRIFVNLLTP